MRHPLPTTTKHSDLSLALIGDRVQGGVTGLNRGPRHMWEAPMRRGCGLDGLTGCAQVILERHHLPPSALALVVIAEQGTPRRATGRQTPGIHAVSLRRP